MPQAGIDFEDYFDNDLFAIRRSPAFNAGNPYDPESLLSGDEVANGLGYQDKRQWPNEGLYRQAVAGVLDTATILRIAPRVNLTDHEPYQFCTACNVRTIDGPYRFCTVCVARNGSD